MADVGVHEGAEYRAHAVTPAELLTRSYERALAEVLDALTRQVRPSTPRASTGTSDALDLAAQAFVETLLSSATRLDKLEPDEAKRLGERAAEQVIASAHWARVVGDRLDTTQATRLLTGSVLALPGNGASWYPVWQFEVDQAAVRPETGDIIGAFHERLVEVEPLLIASWATRPRPADLAARHQRNG